MTIYVVSGSIGEYSDRTEWLVKAFTDEEKAKELVVNATDRARVIAQTIEEDDYGSYYSEPQPIQFRNEFDADSGTHLYGRHPARYTYFEIELEGIEEHEDYLCGECFSGREDKCLREKGKCNVL